MTHEVPVQRREAEQRALQKELQRTRRELASRDPAEFARELGEFAQRSSALADTLAPAIRSCMLDGFVGVIGGERAKVVRRRFSAWLHSPDPEAPGLSGYLVAAAHRRLSALQSRGLIGKANETIDAQARLEAILLAQLLVANWNAVLEHAGEDGRKEALETLFQTQFYPLPMEALFGAGLYRLPLEVTYEILVSYLRATQAARPTL